MTGSLKNATRALNTIFAEPELPYPFPDELERVIELFVETHQDIDDYDSQKLHDELLWIFNKHVIGNQEKHGPFVATLRMLQPVLRGEKRLDEWWGLVIRPTIDAVGHKRDEIEDAREFLLGILVFDVEDDVTGEKAAVSAQFTKKLLGAYLARTRLPSFEDMVSPEDEFLAHELEGILVAFGRKNPKQLLMAIDDMMVDKNLRLQALSLLSSFVRLQPPHLHLVLETSLIGHLHTCLLLDNSTTVVDLALTILIMFIPHITTTLVADLPRLFLIYARILCWDKYNNESAVRASQSEASESEYGSDVEPKQAMHFNPTWDVIEANIDSSQSLRPKADYLFTFLYGLFPLNFMNFVRKPRRYLKMKSYPRAEDLDMNQNLIRSRTEAHRTQHKLHPNFFMTTAEDELIDNRWLKSDPADLVSECLGLCIAISASLSDRDPGPPPTAKLPALPRKARSVASRIFTTAGDDERLSIHTQDFRPLSNRTTLSTTMTGTTANFPDPVRTLPRQSSQMSLTETTKSPRDSSPLTRILGGDSKNDSPIDTRPQTPRFDHMRFPTSAPPSPPRSVVNSSSLPKVPSLQSFAQALSRFPIPHCSAPGSDGYNTAVLQREVMLLKNDLNFERYQKQKYIEQIGNLQRKHMSDVTVETDTQNLMNQNRSLKSRLVKSDERYEQLKKEMAASRTQAKRFEDQLTARLKSYREDEKKWHSEIQTLKHSLAMSKVESEDLQAIVIDTERRERDSRNQMGTLEFNFDDIGKLRSKVAELETKLREYEQRDLEYQRAREEHNTLLAELQTTRMKLTALDQEREQMHNQFEQKIQTLEANERNSSIVGSAHSSSLPGSIQQMIDSALAAQQNKFTQLKRNYTKLHHKFQEIETRNQELEGVTNNNGRQSVLSLTRFADDSSIKGGVDRQSSFGSGSASGSISHSRSARRHDFAPSGSSNDAMQLNFDDQQSHMHRPHTQGAIISRTSSGGLAANATNPLPRGHESRDMGATFEQAFSNDFTSPTSPTDNLADSLQFGGGAQGKPMLEIRSYGRGGAGNLRKPKDKEPTTKKSGFRLKGII